MILPMQTSPFFHPLYLVTIAIMATCHKFVNVKQHPHTLPPLLVVAFMSLFLSTMILSPNLLPSVIPSVLCLELTSRSYHPFESGMIAEGRCITIILSDKRKWRQSDKQPTEVCMAHPHGASSSSLSSLPSSSSLPCSSRSLPA